LVFIKINRKNESIAKSENTARTSQKLTRKQNNTYEHNAGAPFIYNLVSGIRDYKKSCKAVTSNFQSWLDQTDCSGLTLRRWCKADIKDVYATINAVHLINDALGLHGGGEAINIKVTSDLLQIAQHADAKYKKYQDEMNEKYVNKTTV